MIRSGCTVPACSMNGFPIQEDPGAAMMAENFPNALPGTDGGEKELTIFSSRRCAGSGNPKQTQHHEQTKQPGSDRVRHSPRTDSVPEVLRA